MKTTTLLLSALMLAAPAFAYANNACKAPTIITSADVSTSYGAEYQMNTYFRTPKEAAAVFVRDTASRMMVEGDFAWSDQEGGVALADDNLKRFVIGHQFHALALRFDEIATDISQIDGVAFRGETYNGRQGDYPFGGTMTLVEDSSGQLLGLILNLPEESEITVFFDDWRSTAEGAALPYSLTIAHENNEFYYTYTDIYMLDKENGKDSIDFQKAYPAPDIDEVNIYRLHRALLAAHCRGDADKIAALTAPEAVIVNRGDLATTTPEETRRQFESLFSRVRYRNYHDLKDPVVSVAQSGDLGWIAVNPLAEGRVIETGETFSAQWAWVMLAQKIDGVWLHAGNASNRKTQ